MVPPQGSKTAQGYELQLGTNNLAPFLFTKLLTPIMVKTAQAAVTGTVRVVWVASSAVSMSPEGGVDMTNLDYKVEKSAWQKYSISKAGNFLHARELARRHKDGGIISVVRYATILHLKGADFSQAVDPGMLKTDLWVNTPTWQKVAANLILHDPIYGAYTELYGGLSPEINTDKTGAWSK